MEPTKNIDNVSSARLELGFTGLELLTQSYLNALNMVTEHTGREVASLRGIGGIKIQVAREGIDNVGKAYGVVKENLPATDYSNLRALADKMYAELSDVMAERK